MLKFKIQIVNLNYYKPKFKFNILYSLKTKLNNTHIRFQCEIFAFEQSAVG